MWPLFGVSWIPDWNLKHITVSWSADGIIFDTHWVSEVCVWYTLNSELFKVLELSYGINRVVCGHMHMHECFKFLFAGILCHCSQHSFPKRSPCWQAPTQTLIQLAHSLSLLFLTLLSCHYHTLKNRLPFTLGTECSCAGDIRRLHLPALLHPLKHKTNENTLIYTYKHTHTRADVRVHLQ